MDGQRVWTATTSLNHSLTLLFQLLAFRSRPGEVGAQFSKFQLFLPHPDPHFRVSVFRISAFLSMGLLC